MPEPPDIDLVVPTVGRTLELERFLASVAGRTWPGLVRVLVVDQNPDDRLGPIVARFEEHVTVRRLRSEPGVSRACNVGFQHSTAAIVGRADDDCWYPPDALGRVVEAFDEHSDWDAICGITCNESGRPTQLRWHAASGVVTRGNVFRRALGATLFLRRPLVEALGDWDESYGPRPYPDGTIRGGSEDGEYILRILDGGFTLGYEPSIRVFHADFHPSASDRRAMNKAYFYGFDHTRLLKRYGYPWWYPAWRSAQLAAASAIFLIRGETGRARFYAAMARGRLAGLLAGVRTGDSHH
ncbi:MAG TPA: glycosyltransferase [Gaiellaceae bacterium]|nr:glycosyltransferase [Gaiellaceae bacterium]